MWKKELKNLMKSNEKLERIIVEDNEDIVDIFEIIENNDFNNCLDDFIKFIDENYLVNSYEVKYNYIIIKID